MTDPHDGPSATGTVTDQPEPDHIVDVEVTTGWTSPDAPRSIDGLAVADVPDVAGWLDAMDRVGVESRLELHGRTLTQLERGEPVQIVEDRDAWVRVVAPWQPTPDDGRGYPMWVRRAHLRPRHAADAASPASTITIDADTVLDYARQHLGLGYLWGGTCRWAVDCSGLVHRSFRAAGLVVPRDADPQHQAAEPIPLGEERAGDLYFFAREDGWVYHVGFVTQPGSMLHAPETGRIVEERELAPERASRLVAAGRFIA